MQSKDASFDKFQNFINAFGATRLLLRRAHDQGFLIEGLVLYASLIDSFCRICLVLKEQLENKTDHINEKYIYQFAGNSGILERKIYDLAYKNKIISKKIFDELNSLYDIRNKAIHRFFISEIEYSHLEVVCKRYENLYNNLWQIAYYLESEQINKGVGMTIGGKKMTDRDKAKIRFNIMSKIKSGNEKNLAKTLNCVSVKEIVEFGAKKGLLKKCICGHEKIHHIDQNFLKNNKSKKLNQALSKCFIKGCNCSSYKSNKSHD